MPCHRKDRNGTKKKKYQDHFDKIKELTSKGTTNKKKKIPKKK